MASAVTPAAPPEPAAVEPATHLSSVDVRLLTAGQLSTQIEGWRRLAANCLTPNVF